jgi:hypothetical protein
VLHAGEVFRRSIVELDSGRLVITKFSGEEHSTIFVSGLVAVVAEERITSSQTERLKQIVKSAPLVETAILRAMRYLKSQNLFAESSDSPLLLTLQR